MSAKNLELDVKENGVLDSNGSENMSSVVRIQKYGCFDAPMTRSRTSNFGGSGPATAESLYRYKIPIARLGDARGVNDITIR